MNTSYQINELAAALAKAQGMMDNAVMNRINPHFKSKYADLAAVFDAARKPLSANGLAIVQTINNGVLHTRLLHTSGQWIASEYPLPTSGRPQEVGSALTYARRYSLSALIGIAADEDDDANTADKAHKVPPKPAPNIMKPAGTRVNAQTGEITETAAPEDAASPGAVDAAPPEETPPKGGAAQSIQDLARREARKGGTAARTFWLNCTPEEQELIREIQPEIKKLIDAAEEAEGNG